MSTKEWPVTFHIPATPDGRFGPVGIECDGDTITIVTQDPETDTRSITFEAGEQLARVIGALATANVRCQDNTHTPRAQ